MAVGVIARSLLDGRRRGGHGGRLTTGRVIQEL
jgi:hypothetical protein